MFIQLTRTTGKPLLLNYDSIRGVDCTEEGDTGNAVLCVEGFAWRPHVMETVEEIAEILRARSLEDARSEPRSRTIRTRL